MLFFSIKQQLLSLLLVRFSNKMFTRQSLYIPAEMLPDFGAESGDIFSILVSFPVPLMLVGNDAPPSEKQQVIFSFLFLFNLNAESISTVGFCGVFNLYLQMFKN